MSAPESSPHQMLAPHQAEIRRRAQVHSEGNDAMNSKIFERIEDDGLDDPFENPEQIFVVFSLSQREFAPVPRDPAKPAICIYGAFETRAEAMEHVSVIQKMHPTHSILIDTTHNWICAAATTAHLLDSEYIENKKTTLLKVAETQQETARREFEENVANHTAGNVETRPTEEDSPTTEPTESEQPEEGNTTHASTRVHRNCRVDGQTLAVISVLPDDSADCEFIFRVYALYNDEASANRYVRNVCGCRVQNHHIDVINTCSWAFPQQMKGDKVRKEVYRSDELNKVMNALKRSPQEVQHFYEQQTAEKTDSTTPQIDVEGGTLV